MHSKPLGYYVSYYYAHLSSTTTNQLGSQIKLWKGNDLVNLRSKILVKQIKNLYLLHALCQIGLHIVVASTTNHEKDICMMNENDVENCVSQKRPTIAQVTMSQKKAKGKLFFEAKHPPFLLGF